MTSGSAIIDSCYAIHASRGGPNSLELVNHLLDRYAVAIKLQERFHHAACIEQPFGSVLVPLDEAVERLISARTAAEELRTHITIFACTDARSAVAVTNDSDKRDHRYLSGLTSWDGNHAYCGGLDATIGRSLLYAPHADVVCFKSSAPSVSEAKRFAVAVRTAFPEKKLAFGYSPKPDGLRWNEMDHAHLESDLYSLGYDYYFFTQFGSPVFPHFPSETPWVMFDDSLRELPCEH